MNNIEFRSLVVPTSLDHPDAADFAAMVDLRNAVYREINGNEDETVTFRFNKNTNDPEQQDHNLKMLAWREYAGAWHVLDARASTILPTLDTYVEGDVS